MKTLFLLLLFCHGSSVKHTMKLFSTGSTGLSNIPEFMATVEFDGILLAYCNTNIRRLEIRQDWVKMFYKNNSQHLEPYKAVCWERLPVFFKATIKRLKQLFNQSGGVHVLQRIDGCDWDDETGKIKVFSQYGYDGEDLISLDLKTLTWIAQKLQAVTIKQRWDADKTRTKNMKNYLTLDCPEWLKKLLASGNSSLLRTDLPTVSLLQKTPSSPVSCHATGFYPERATLSWRKDGEELHEDVELGEILPNHDGTFQMSAELKLSSVTPEDWSRYTCVLQLSGVKEDIVTKLDKAHIRTNWEFPTGAVVGVVVGLLLLTLCICGLLMWRRNRTGFRPAETQPPPDELCQDCFAETQFVSDLTAPADYYETSENLNKIT
uniref:major histocompatibility complex class I-related gene protein-like isoform X2 n=1 Tax=Scatophagus argus TaxID=75038 RepID=UPI001ED825FD|nr:major histocompatibility complex class I-related gene protein-like isoform X2 [Scatophagus argus]